MIRQVALAGFVLAVVALASACQLGAELEQDEAALAEDATELEPWTVVATQVDPVLGGSMLTIEYVAPNGARDRWQRPYVFTIGGRLIAERNCWQSAAVGEPLPDCARP